MEHNPRTLEKYQAYYNSRIPLGIGEEYLDWKNVIHLFYGDPISRLTAGFRIDLKTLGDSHYTIGAALKCSQVIERTPNSCPSCPDILGVVHVREDEAAYYFKVDSNLFQGGETVKLTPQFEMQLTDEIYLWVDDNYILSVHDTKRSNYTNVYNRNDIFLPYDTSLIFKAIVKSETELEVVDFSEDVKFKVFYNRTDDIWQFFYTDPIASKQRIYEYRAVDLHPLGGNKFILNFNFSYARFIAPKFKGFVNHLRKEVIAGVEYHLF
ncbi:hypothetical protein HK103_007075 [Boothiomyces macroporosus]|uniref:Uncharacterized protein n=1 Tax=Boothiomyces macroporosus TaxID=261099 RepID=A0AAD5UCN7_9FUNG|nr:hypothetical protein HK103_007075 [Boothiomyces macroporosus]